MMHSLELGFYVNFDFDMNVISNMCRDFKSEEKKKGLFFIPLNQL